MQNFPHSNIAVMSIERESDANETSIRLSMAKQLLSCIYKIEVFVTVTNTFIYAIEYINQGATKVTFSPLYKKSLNSSLATILYS